MTDATVIEDAARVAFAAYYRTRPGYTWGTAPFPVVRRWTLVAAQVLNGGIRTPVELRNAYCDGLDGAPAWTVKQANIWGEVLRAMHQEVTVQPFAAPTITPLVPLRDRLKQRRGAA